MKHQEKTKEKTKKYLIEIDDPREVNEQLIYDLFDNELDMKVKVKEIL